MDEKICIIDGVEEGENGNFLGKIEAMIGTAPVDYIIVNHVEPDHSGSIKNMLKIYPEIKVVGNAKTINKFVKYYLTNHNRFIKIFQ